MQRFFLFGLISLAISLVPAGNLLGQENLGSKNKKSNPLVGSWDLEVNWGKGEGGKTAKYILIINRDLSGMIKDNDEGWTSQLRKVKTDEKVFYFSFYYGDGKDFSIDFEGKLENKKIVGSFSAFDTKGEVIGRPLDSSDPKVVESRPSVMEAYEARTFTSSEGDTMRYRLFVPPNYNARKKYPVVLFHHGGGGAGNDNRSQLEGACVREWIRTDFQTKHPCLIVAPQFPGKEEFAKKERGPDGKGKIDGMQLQVRTIHEMLDSLEQEFSIDKNREYVTGLSFGGDCTWFSLFERPARFAAAAPICAGYTLDSSAAERAKKMAGLPIWIFHGDEDKVVPVKASRQMVKALKDAKGNPKYTEYAGVGHYCWDKAYRDSEFVDWLFMQSRAAKKN